MDDRKRKGSKTAVALGYDGAIDPAPRVLAAGRGEIAESILSEARKHGLPIHEDHPLAEALARLEIGHSVPPELYGAVAEVLAYLWNTEQELERASKGGTHK